VCSVPRPAPRDSRDVQGGVSELTCQFVQSHKVEKHLPFWVEVEGESVTKRNPNPYRKWAF